MSYKIKFNAKLSYIISFLLIIVVLWIIVLASYAYCYHFFYLLAAHTEHI